MAKMGRPKIPIDWKQFDQLCFIQCSLNEIAFFFGCSIDTIEKRVKVERGVTFSEYFGKKRVGGLISLRRNLFKQSEKSAAVAIFLAKNWLGLRDNQSMEVTGKDGAPLPTQTVVMVVSDNAKTLTNEILQGKGTEVANNGSVREASPSVD